MKKPRPVKLSYDALKLAIAKAAEAHGISQERAWEAYNIGLLQFFERGGQIEAAYQAELDFAHQPSKAEP